MTREQINRYWITRAVRRIPLPAPWDVVRRRDYP